MYIQYIHTHTHVHTQYVHTHMYIHSTLQSLNKAQQDRVFELLSEVESSAESSLSSAQPVRSQQVCLTLQLSFITHFLFHHFSVCCFRLLQAFRGKRPSLSQSVRRLFRLKVDTEDPVPDTTHSQ